MCDDQRKPGIYVNGVHSETITNAAFTSAVREMKAKLPLPPGIDSVKALEWLNSVVYGSGGADYTWKPPNVTLGSENDQ